MLIGVSIHEAIDWTQDRLRTTRPLAEHTLFALLTAKRVTETDQGFILAEDSEEEVQKHHAKAKTSAHRPRFRFHRARKQGHKHLRTYIKHLKHLDNSDAANDMWDSEEPD